MHPVNLVMYDRGLSMGPKTPLPDPSVPSEAKKSESSELEKYEIAHRVVNGVARNEERGRENREDRSAAYNPARPGSYECKS